MGIDLPPIFVPLTKLAQLVESGHKAGKHLSLALIPTPGAVHGSHDVPNEIFLEEVWAIGYCQWRAG